MYAFRESKRGEILGALVEETKAPRAVERPITEPPPQAMTVPELAEPTGTRRRVVADIPAGRPSVDGTLARTSGTRLISFPPCGTAPPIGLAEAGMEAVTAERDANATHRPTGDTTPPFVAVAQKDSATLEGLFSSAVMDTLPGFG